MRSTLFRSLALVVLAAAAPLAQERTLVARFSATQWREPTFVVSRAAYVALFEIVTDLQVRQLYPRGSAAAATRLPAGETPLAMLDVNVGRLVEAPGVRTVFWQGGSYGQRRAPESAVTDARTFLLVASDEPLTLGLPSEFGAAFDVALARVDSTLPGSVRTVQAVVAAVHPASRTADVASELETMWLAWNPALRGAAASIGANDPYNSGLGCDAIYPYGYAAFTTYASMRGCPEPYIPVWFGHGWGYGGVVFVPAPRSGGGRAPIIGVPPNAPATAPHLSARVRRLDKQWPIEQVPASTIPAFAPTPGTVRNVAGGGLVERVPAPGAPMPVGGGAGGPPLRAAPERARQEFVPIGVPAAAPPRGGPRAVSAPPPVLGAPAAARPAASAPRPAPSSNGGRGQASSDKPARPHR